MNESEVRKELDSIIKSLQQIDLSKKREVINYIIRGCSKINFSSKQHY